MENTEALKKNRIEWIDIAKGIAILLVVFGHSIDDITKGIIFSFHMPLFFILSCVTFRLSNDGGEFFKRTEKAFRHLFMSAVAMVFLRELIILIFECMKNSFSFWDAIKYRLANILTVFVYASGANVEVSGSQVWRLGLPWFLIALFFGRTLFDYLHLKLSTNIFYISIALCSVFGVVLGSIQWLPFSFDIALAIQPLFLFGHWLKGFEWKKRAIQNILISFVIWAILFGISWKYFGTFMELADRRYTIFPWCFVCAIAGTMVVSGISWFVSKIKYVKEPIKYIGKHSIIMIWIHFYDEYFINIYESTESPLINGLIRVGLDVAVFALVMFAIDHLRAPVKTMFISCKKSIKNNATVFMLFITGFIARWFYILYTSIYDRQHDVANFDIDGHYGYINYIMNNGLLPDFDPRTVFQFAHPPLHHLLCAWWIKLMTNVFGASIEEAAESLQYLTLLYSTVLMYVAYRIFKHLKLEGMPLCVAMAVICFHPTFIILSGSCNNDMLSIMLMAVSLLFAIKWYQGEKWRDFILSAVVVGLSVMTKSSSVLVAVPIGVLIVVKLINKIREHDIKRTVLQILSYGCISLPIGMWFHIYNLIRWEVPLFFVYPMNESLPMFVGNVPVLKRLFDFSPSQLSSVYQQWTTYNEAGEQITTNDYNPLISLLKTSDFGEFIGNHTFDARPEYNAVAVILFYSGAILAIGSFIYMMYNLIKKRGTVYIERLALGAFFIAMIISFYVTSFKYPFECTMDFRYIPLTALVGAFFLGAWTQQLTEKQDGQMMRVRRGTVGGIMFMVALFAMSSIMMYIGLYQINH